MGTSSTIGELVPIFNSSEECRRLGRHTVIPLVPCILVTAGREEGNKN